MGYALERYGLEDDSNKRHAWINNLEWTNRHAMERSKVPYLSVFFCIKTGTYIITPVKLEGFRLWGRIDFDIFISPP